jgi:AcrR family transcriptional regulator
VTDRGSKGERTRAAIIDAALELFRENGYDATTMRGIATAAGVSVGNAYYYFESKEQLIQGVYEQTQATHADLVADLLQRETDLERRIVGTGDAWFDAMAPYHAFASKFFKHAAEPTSPLSPFSPDSTPTRARAIDLWRTVIEGSDTKVPKKLAGEVPELVWLLFMALVLFWVYDQTPGQAATHRMLRRVAPMVVRAIGLARLPVVRGMLDDIIAIVNEVRLVFATDTKRLDSA